MLRTLVAAITVASLTSGPVLRAWCLAECGDPDQGVTPAAAHCPDEVNTDPMSVAPASIELPDDCCGHGATAPILFALAAQRGSTSPLMPMIALTSLRDLVFTIDLTLASAADPRGPSPPIFPGTRILRI